MNKNIGRLMIGATLGIALCMTGCVPPWSHPSAAREVGIGPQLELFGPNAAIRDAKWKATNTQTGRLDDVAMAALAQGRYAEAEVYARKSVTLGWPAGRAQESLAVALYAQGKTQEALKAYKVLADEGDVFPRNELPYALLLLRTGHWAQAANAYNKMLPYIDERNLMRASGPFSPTVPQPRELAVAIHIGLGLTGGWWCNAEGSDPRDQMLNQFHQALALEPDSPLTNYCYGYGWQQLGRTSQVKNATAAQAKAAFQKAAASGDGEVKKKAEEALRDFKYPASPSRQ